MQARQTKTSENENRPEAKETLKEKRRDRSLRSQTRQAKSEVGRELKQESPMTPQHICFSPTSSGYESPCGSIETLNLTVKQWKQDAQKLGRTLEEHMEIESRALLDHAVAARMHSLRKEAQKDKGKPTESEKEKLKKTEREAKDDAGSEEDAGGEKEAVKLDCRPLHQGHIELLAEGGQWESREDQDSARGSVPHHSLITALGPANCSSPQRLSLPTPFRDLSSLVVEAALLPLNSITALQPCLSEDLLAISHGSLPRAQPRNFGRPNTPRIPACGPSTLPRGPATAAREL